MEEEKVSFGGKIPADLKARIESQVDESRIPMGVAVLSLAEFWADMTIEEKRHFCFGTNATTFAAYIRHVCREEIDAALDHALAARAERLGTRGSAVTGPRANGSRSG
jgi:hypothetical protein